MTPTHNDVFDFLGLMALLTVCIGIMAVTQ